MLEKKLRGSQRPTDGCVYLFQIRCGDKGTTKKMARGEVYEQAFAKVFDGERFELKVSFTLEPHETAWIYLSLSHDKPFLDKLISGFPRDIYEDWEMRSCKSKANLSETSIPWLTRIKHARDSGI